MTNKYDAPSGAPPAYLTSTSPPPNDGHSPYPPQAAHIPPSQNGSSSEYYGASPYQQHASPYPPTQGYPQQGYPPQGGYGPPQGAYGAPGGYYQQGPPMAYPQQGRYPGGEYPPQQGGYYGPQGGYMDQRRGGNAGFMEALLASLACCCCLDACLLF